MEMTYDGALVMPKNFVAVTEDEMEYIDGGLTGWQKAAIATVVVIAGAALITSIVTGTIAIAISSFATVMRYGVVVTLCNAIGTGATVTAILTAFGASATLIAAMINKFC